MGFAKAARCGSDFAPSSNSVEWPTPQAPYEIESEIAGWLIRRRILAKNRTCFADFLWILVQNAPFSPVRTRICRSKSFLSSHLQRNRYACGHEVA
jgi:hypothetical protein